MVSLVLSSVWHTAGTAEVDDCLNEWIRYFQWAGSPAHTWHCGWPCTHGHGLDPHSWELHLQHTTPSLQPRAMTPAVGELGDLSHPMLLAHLLSSPQSLYPSYSSTLIVPLLKAPVVLLQAALLLPFFPPPSLLLYRFLSSVFVSFPCKITLLPLSTSLASIWESEIHPTA